MGQTVRAIHRSGRLYLLDKVDLREGQIYSIVITPIDEDEEIDVDEIQKNGEDEIPDAEDDN
jgi:predicted DNA-binding antitoxin AbrB/MazE fold protein